MRGLSFAIILAVAAAGSTARAAESGRGDQPRAGRDGGPFRLEDLAGTEPGDARLFLKYVPGGVSIWNPGWPARLDLTGVAWNSRRTATAVTPRHVVMAAHFRRRPGEALVFHDRRGRPHRRSLVKMVTLQKKPVFADIAVGLLDRPLPKAIKPYPLLEPRADYADLLAGAPVVVTDQKRRLYIHEVRFVQERAIWFAHAPAYPGAWRKKLITGDSGNPSFLLVAGEPVLVETHTSGGAGLGPFYSSPRCFAAVTDAARRLDPAHRIRTVALDAAFLQRAKTCMAAREKEGGMWNTDGSRKSASSRNEPTTAPGTAGNPTPARPAPAATPRQPSTPTARRPPRIRRVPVAPDASGANTPRD